MMMKTMNKYDSSSRHYMFIFGRVIIIVITTRNFFVVKCQATGL